jgi:hypothetical protein
MPNITLPILFFGMISCFPSKYWATWPSLEIETNDNEGRTDKKVKIKVHTVYTDLQSGQLCLKILQLLQQLVLALSPHSGSLYSHHGYIKHKWLDGVNIIKSS